MKQQAAAWKRGEVLADAYESGTETSSEFFVHSKSSYYQHAVDTTESGHQREAPTEDAQPQRFVAGNQFFNYNSFGSLREGLMPVSLLSKTHLGLAVTAFMAGITFTFLSYGYRPLLVAYLSRHHPSQYSAAKYLLDWPGAFSVFIGLVSDCVPLRGSRRKSYILLGWFVSVIAFAGIAITNQFGVGSVVVYDDDTEKANAENGRSSEDHDDSWVFGVLYVSLSFVGCFALQTAYVAALALIIEYAQREALHMRGNIASTFLILYYAAALVVQGAVTQMFNPTAIGSIGSSDAFDVTALKSAISLGGAGVALMVGAAIPLPFAYYMLDENSSGAMMGEFNAQENTQPMAMLDPSASPKRAQASPVGYTSNSRGPTAVPLTQGITQLWRFCQQNVVYRTLLFLLVAVLLVGIYNQNVRDALKHWCDISASESLTVQVVKSGFTLLGLLHAKRWMLNMSWKVVASMCIVLMVSIFLTETLPIVFDAVRAKWFYALMVGVVEWPKSWLEIYYVLTPTEIAVVGAEGATIGVVLSFYVLSIATAHTMSDGLSHVTGTSVSMSEVDADSHSTRTSVLTTALVYYGINLVGLVTVLWMPSSKLDAQQLRAFGGYSRWWGGLVVSVFLVLLVAVLVINVVNMAS